MKICVYDKIVNKPLNPFCLSFLILILFSKILECSSGGGGQVVSVTMLNNQLTIGRARVCCMKVLAREVNAFWSSRMTGYIKPAAYILAKTMRGKMKTNCVFFFLSFFFPFETGFSA